ncbi:AfsR/SARP family transcriptional regulator [Paractinoplanes deccanensis]|nr:BTAD domain-containing putative transcriptional regulator [Actinoplanes deccanensis]
MRVRVFGGLRLWRDGVEVALGPARQRAVLAVLLAARGTVVRTSELVDAIWSDRPPDSAVNQVRRLIGQVRRLFEPDLPNREDGAWVKPVGDGYRLSLDARVSDLAAFFTLVDDARAVGRAEAAQKYEQALRLARDQPFAELPPALTGLPAFRAIETARVQAAVEAADAALGEPRAHHLLPLLQHYAAAAPLHEPLQARVVRLLTAAGRRAEALAHFEEVRRRLAEELGADPGAELRAAHLDAVTDPATPDANRPAQLPLRVAAFSPRPQLADGMAAGRGSGLIVLSGMGGSGKTALAVDWAHRIAGDYPDGQLYLDLRGFEPGGRQLRPVEALATMLLSLGATPNGSADLNALGAQFRSVMAKQRMLVLLDNARDSAQVRPLLPAAPGCLVVITSRNRVPSLVAREGAWPVHVDRLSFRASKDLLALRLGAARLAGEPAAADRLVRLCAGLPLALSIAAARAAVSPQMSLNDVAAELTRQRCLSLRRWVDRAAAAAALARDPYWSPADDSAGRHPRRRARPYPVSASGPPRPPRATGHCCARCSPRSRKPQRQRTPAIDVGVQPPVHHAAGRVEPGRAGGVDRAERCPAHRDSRVPAPARPGLDRRARRSLAANRRAPGGGGVDRETARHLPGSQRRGLAVRVLVARCPARAAPR